MREVLGAGRGVQAGEVEIPAMAAEAGSETRQGAAGDEESDGCDGAQDCNTTVTVGRHRGLQNTARRTVRDWTAKRARQRPWILETNE